MKTLVVLLFIIGFISCKKKIDELPSATQNGSNSFGCLLDGKIWVPQKNAIFTGAAILEALQMPNNDLYINARNFASSPNESEFEIFIKDMNGTGTYSLNTTLSGPSTAASYAYYVKRNINPQNEWMTSATYTGMVTITAYSNVAPRFVSGIFEFRAINLYNAPQPITVTEGRFDVKLQ